MLSEQVIPEEFRSLADVQAGEEEGLLAKPNVNGVALGSKYTDGQDTGEQSIIVLVEQKLPEDMLPADARVPSTVNKIPTDVQEVGVITAGQQLAQGLAPSQQLAQPLAPGVSRTDGAVTVTEEGITHLLRPDDVALAAREQVGPFALVKRTRPAFGGVSVGHFKVTAGTLGTCCYDASAFPGIPARYYILSNNHVLANSNNASPGDPVLQPGVFDGGIFPADVIARLSRFVPIRFIQAGQPVPVNFVDAAIAEGRFDDLDRRIYWTGHLRGIAAPPTVGLPVEKTGRTTNFTTGRVQNINATVNVNYGNGRVARFARQILTTNMSAPGDSGSMICDLDERAVGLLFAGSPVVTVVNPIALVQLLLGIRVTET
jgi:hypothetical protein